MTSQVTSHSSTLPLHLLCVVEFIHSLALTPVNCFHLLTVVFIGHLMRSRRCNVLQRFMFHVSIGSVFKPWPMYLWSWCHGKFMISSPLSLESIQEHYKCTLSTNKSSFWGPTSRYISLLFMCTRKQPGALWWHHQPSGSHYKGFPGVWVCFASLSFEDNICIRSMFSTKE